MSLTIARLAADTRTFTWKYLGENVEVAYRPNALTFAWTDTDLVTGLVDCIISVDVTDAEGKVLKPTANNLRTLPLVFLRALTNAISADSQLDPTKAGSSGAS